MANYAGENAIKGIGKWVLTKINNLNTNIINTYLSKSDAATTYLNKTDAANTYKKSSDLATVATSGSYEDLSNKPEIPSAVDISGKADITVNEKVADIEETYSQYYYKITEDTVDESNYSNYYYLNNYQITFASELEEYDGSIIYYEKVNRVSEAINEEDKKYYLEDGKYYDISSIQNYEYDDEIIYYNIDLTESIYEDNEIIISKYNYNNNIVRISDIENLKGNVSNNYNTLEKIENNKPNILFIDIYNDYNYLNFGLNNFRKKYDEEDKHLIDFIFNDKNKNNIILLKYLEELWLVISKIDTDQSNSITFIKITNLFGKNSNNENISIIYSDELLTETFCNIQIGVATQLKNVENPYTLFYFQTFESTNNYTEVLLDIQESLRVINNTLAPLNSPNFSGEPTAPTPDLTDSSTKIATTEFVINYINTKGVS